MEEINVLLNKKQILNIMTMIHFIERRKGLPPIHTILCDELDSLYNLMDYNYKKIIKEEEKHLKKLEKKGLIKIRKDGVIIIKRGIKYEKK